MNKIDNASRKVQPAPLQVSRVFSAPRETVFKAWSSADHIERWFCPNGYSVPEAKVEMRAGGAFEVCMRSPEGVDHWTKGTFTEVVAPERLTIDHHVIDPCGGATAVQRRDAGQVQSRRWRHADGGGADL
jgi:Activator of Hsp90 ATPase homolog 1-like protein